MVRTRGLSLRIRLTGLFASLIAVSALGVTVLANNADVGFGHTVTRGEQVSLLVLATLLLVAQTIGYLIQRARRRRTGRNERATTAAHGTKK
jgi:hypothetical protein